MGGLRSGFLDDCRTRRLPVTFVVPVCPGTPGGRISGTRGRRPPWAQTRAVVPEVPRKPGQPPKVDASSLLFEIYMSRLVLCVLSEPMRVRLEVPRRGK